MRRLSFLLIIIIFSYCAPASCQTDQIRIHFIDVDAGDAVLIETPKGRSILVDAGNYITGFKVANYLKENGIESLDYLILTHPHSDHVGGVFFIMQMLDVVRTFDNGEKLGESDMLHWYARLIRENDNYNALKKGDKLNLDGVELRVIWPPKPSIFTGWNDNSLVILLEFGGFRCLFMGDASAVVEEELLKDEETLKADLLKVGHHGYLDGTSEAFLKIVDPKVSVIHVKEDSIYSQISEKVPQRLIGAGSEVYRTDKDGTVVITADIKGNLKRDD
jgi:competence protein ComEC